MLPVYITGRQAATLEQLLACSTLETSTVTLRTIATLRTKDCVTVLSVSDAGFALAEVKALRGAGYPGKLIVLSALQLDEEDLCQLYEAGADNCMSGDYSAALFVKLVVAQARQYHAVVRPVISLGNVCLYPSEYRVTIANVVVHFRPKEYGLLCFLMRNPDTPFFRRELSVAMGGINQYDERTVDGYIARVRKQLSQNGVAGLLIRTEPGTGYRLVASA